MKVHGLARAILVGAVGVALGSLPAAAQTVTFSTTGAFSGACSGTSCVWNNFTLSFTPVGSNSFFSGSLVDLGSFNTQCDGCTPAIVQAFPSGVMFTLTVNQTNPSNGANTFVGNVSGSLSFNPSFSSLIWTPAPNAFNIGSASYALVTDNTGNFNIAPPTGDANPNASVVKAFVTTTPEPSIVAASSRAQSKHASVRRQRESRRGDSLCCILPTRATSYAVSSIRDMRSSPSSSARVTLFRLNKNSGARVTPSSVTGMICCVWIRNATAIA
jgi:hypothetical protein